MYERNRHYNTAVRLAFIAVFSVVVIGLYSLTGPVNRGGEGNYEAAQEQTPTDQTPPQIESRFYGQNKSVTCEMIANINYREGGYGQDDISRCDLRAQRQMALFTAVIAGLTFIGLIVLWKTLRATQATLTEAENTTKAAIETTEVTRQIGEASEAAYLGIEKVEIQFVANDDNEDPERMNIFLYVTVRNRGQTPAYRPRYSIEGGTCASGREYVELREQGATGRFKYIGPQQEIVETFNMGQWGVPDADIDEMLAGEAAISVSLDITYGLVFKRPNSTRKSGWLPRHGYQKFFSNMEGPDLLAVNEMERDWLPLY